MIETFSQEDFDLLMKVFLEKGVNKNCPRCGRRGFTIEQGFYNFPRYSNEQGTGGSYEVSPSFMTYCNNCGYFAFHSMNLLDLEYEDGALKRV